MTENKIGMHEIRRRFLKFFESKGHLVHPSYSLIPKDDKSLLLIGAGMAPLKKYFTKEATPPASRMTTSQKCVRTGDIDNVGKTLRHLTFFEMLGNFSFGDYFKEEAITWAWEFLTEVMGLDKDRLWVSVYKDDDQAFNIWKDKVGIPEERIVRLGKEDNFWELEVGPSGPCSEIHYDKGVEFGCGDPNCKPGCDCDRFLEVWNLVFTQFDKDANGNYNPLPNPNIDTGMGLERIACVMENVESVYDISTIRKIITEVERLSGKKYDVEEKTNTSMRIIADHTRAMTFLISDGVVPSNEGRGYVLRKLMRRAVRHGMLLGIKDMFLVEIINKFIDDWKEAYPELDENRRIILEVVQTEEERFKRTIFTGSELLDAKMKDLKAQNKTEMSGADVFELYDTYGFPAEITEEILSENKLTYNKEEFDTAMEEQKTRAREAIDKSDSGWKKDGNDEIFKGLSNDFSGYSEVEGDTEITNIFMDDKKVDSIKSGDKALVVLANTPFYGESGGQVGDIGTLTGDGFDMDVIDTQKTKGGLFLHSVKVTEGSAKVGDKVFAKIDNFRREDIRRNHSATHLLHAALRQVLGTHVHQAGSLVEADRLRFDFSHYQAMTEEEIAKVERIVNEKVLEAIPVVTEEKPLKEAKEEGVMGLFESKYGEIVRVLKMGKFSMELCGGTHVKNTSEIGLFKIVMETGTAAGVRRIEAITGHAAYEYVLNNEKLIEDIAGKLKANPADILQKTEDLVGENRELKKEVESLKAELLAGAAGDLESKIVDYKGHRLLAATFEDVDANELRSISDEMKGKFDDILVILGAKNGDKVNLLVSTTQKLVKEGVNSGQIVKKIAQALGGNGGGKPDMAMAGAKDTEKLSSVFDDITSYL